MDPLTMGLIAGGTGALLGGLGGAFGGDNGNYGRELKAQRDQALKDLGVGRISNTFRGFAGLMDPYMSAMGEAAQVGANMDQQALQASMARQGLGGSGLGAALGAGLRSGATFQSNQLRARLLSDMFGAAQQNALARANVRMQQALGMNPQQSTAGSIFGGALQGAGVGLQVGSLYNED